jgi:hypothetical protein
VSPVKGPTECHTYIFAKLFLKFIKFSFKNEKPSLYDKLMTFPSMYDKQKPEQLALELNFNK